jgi:phage/plasmid primase-like uncharacterized protein
MTFEDFCRLHGVPLARMPMPGRWVRVPTEDKPKSRNGAVKFMGAYGLVQNWATMTEPALWRAEGESKAAQRRVSEVARQAAQEAVAAARDAAARAKSILGECELATHPYLVAKGFPDEMANVWNRDTDNVLVIPMRFGAELVGCQLIKPDGDKKFLYGQRSGGAQFVIGQRGAHVLCEGYATALSAQQALRNLKTAYVLHVTFSAGNMKKVAETLPGGLVVADNDASGTGERVAREIGWPYWMSDTVGEDANDYAQRCGVFSLAMGLKQAMAVRRRA